jgi:hypothetical protein
MIAELTTAAVTAHHAPHSNGSRIPAPPPPPADPLRALASPDLLLSTDAPPLTAPADLPDLTPRDDKLILALLDANMSIAAVSRQEEVTLTALLRWSWQPHIRAWLAALSELGAMRAKALAANHSAAAVRTLLSVTHLADADFYEQADPSARIRSFESGRKAAGQLLRLGGCHGSPGPAANRADTEGGASATSRPRPVSTGKGGRGCPKPERGAPRSDGAPEEDGSVDVPTRQVNSRRARCRIAPSRPGHFSFDGRSIPCRKRRSCASARALARRARAAPLTPRQASLPTPGPSKHRDAPPPPPCRQRPD